MCLSTEIYCIPQRNTGFGNLTVDFVREKLDSSRNWTLFTSFPLVTRKCFYWGMDLPEMKRIKHKLTESATHHGSHKILAQCNLCFLLATELDSSTRETTTRKQDSALYNSNLCTYLVQQNIFRTMILFQSGWTIWFIARLSLLTGPITKINQSDFFFWDSIFSKYWTGHCP